jgi:predicted O-methyltransferase YrrM
VTDWCTCYGIGTLARSCSACVMAGNWRRLFNFGRAPYMCLPTSAIRPCYCCSSMAFMRRLTSAAQRTAQDPRTLFDLWRKAKSRPISARHSRRVAEYSRIAVDLRDALAMLSIASPDELDAELSRPTFSQVVAELHAYTVPTVGAPMGGPAYLGLCYAAVTLIRPDVVLETGVAHGYSTAVILQALEDNGRGTLYSVDLPAFHPGVTELTGDAIPARLKSSGRWELALGSDKRLLPPLLKKLGSLELALYDSEKSYDGMLRSWELIWRRLRPGGLLITDDVNGHDAYLDFCDRLQIPPVVVAKPTDMQLNTANVFYAGLLRKPPAS